MGASSFWHVLPQSIKQPGDPICMALWVVHKNYWPKSNLHGPKPDVLFTLSSVWDCANLPRLENWLCCCRSSLSHPCGRSMMRVEWKVLQCLTDMFLASSRETSLVISRHLDLESYCVYIYIYMLSFILSCYPFFRHVLIFFDLQGSMLNGQNFGRTASMAQWQAGASAAQRPPGTWTSSQDGARHQGWHSFQCLLDRLWDTEWSNLRIGNGWKWMEMDEHGMEYMSLCFYDSPFLWLLRWRATNINPQTEDGVLARSNPKQKEE